MSWEDVFADCLDHFDFQFEQAPIVPVCASMSTATVGAAVNPAQERGQHIGLSLVHSDPARLKLSQLAVATMFTTSVIVGVHQVEVGHRVACPAWGYVSVRASIGSSRVFVPGALCTATLSKATIATIKRYGGS